MTDEEEEAGNLTNYLTKEVVSKMLQAYRNEEKQDWFTEIAILKKALKVSRTYTSRQNVVYIGICYTKYTYFCKYLCTRHWIPKARKFPVIYSN